MKLREKNEKGLLTDREGTKYSRKSGADQNSPKLRALQACIKVRTKGKSADSRKEWQEMFSRASKKCKEEVEL